MKNFDRFAVSIKGVLKHEGKYLLRTNERREFELLGGRLEKDDKTAQQRLIIEFSEESGIEIQVKNFIEPWLYEIGSKNIIIVPFACEPLKIPDILYDEDGGRLEWIEESEVNSLFMPQGYKDTIFGQIPHKSYSIPANKYFKIIPNYVERDYNIFVRVNYDNKFLFEEALLHYNAPRDFIKNNLQEEFKNYKIIAEEVNIDRSRDAIVLNYLVINE